MTSMYENRDEGDSEDVKKRRKDRKDVTGRQFFSLPRSTRRPDSIFGMELTSMSENRGGHGGDEE
ncbi:hypothetical protein PoB_004556900, partial [Plakobranchus ocellatus]